jgi:hypothetical protein
MLVQDALLDRIPFRPLRKVLAGLAQVAVESSEALRQEEGCRKDAMVFVVRAKRKESE